MSNIPWTRDPFAMGAQLFMLKSPDAARADDISDIVIANTFDRVIGGVALDALGNLALKVHAIGPDLTDITPAQRDDLKVDLDALTDWTSVEVGNVNSEGMIPVVQIVGIKKNAKGRSTVDTIGFGASGDGDIAIARANAEAIASTLSRARQAVADHDAAQIVVRGIGLEQIALDADRAKWFDARSWVAVSVMPHASTPLPHFPRVEIHERKTSKRLADLIAETDGQWSLAQPSAIVLDGVRRADYRRHAVRVDDGSLRVDDIRLPPKALDALAGLARGFDGDMGRAIAQLVGEVA